MNEEFLLKNPGPCSDLLLKEFKHKKNLTKMRSDKSKKNNNESKGMSSKGPNIKLFNADKNESIKIKNNNSIENINLIKDSDSESMATAEPDNESVLSVSPDNSPVKSKKKSFPGLPKIDNEDLKYFSNNKKAKPFIEKQESDDEYSEEESDQESENASTISESESERSVKPKKMSSREKEKRKQELLIKLIALEKKGVNLTKSYSLKSSLEEIEFEYETQRKSAEIEASVHFQQKILMAAVTGVEFLNKKFDPIGAKLEGWSESVMDNINDYEEIFKKLHEKYSERASMPPELQLLVTLVGSGFMFHLTNTLFKSSLPGLGDVLKTNPDIMNNIMGAMGKAMNNSAGISPPSQASQPSQPSQSSQSSQSLQSSQPSQSFQRFQPPIQASQQQRQEFTGPSMNLSSLMNTFESGPSNPMMQQAPKMKQDDIDRFSVASSSDYSELMEDTKTISLPNKGKGKMPKGKTIKI
jgi:hypothetical protein